ncbi:hypothetical protein JTB14_011880 [Gonioctena quinquepunctata]|nr:hypothetical protein JTB14_011880 [Gonioctena quinquepunctata]
MSIQVFEVTSVGSDSVLLMPYETSKLCRSFKFVPTVRKFIFKLPSIITLLFSPHSSATYQCTVDSDKRRSQCLQVHTFQYRFHILIELIHQNVERDILNKVDPRLKYLKNLKYLDLSHNNVQISSIPPLNSLKILILKDNSLKSINLTALPQNIEVLDISQNLLTQIPRDWRSLKYLKALSLHKNPIDCECNNVLNFDRLIKSNVSVPDQITCHSPSKVSGKDITTISCSLDDIMLYDEPAEGSGDADIFDESINETLLRVPFVEEKEDDEIIDNNTIIDDKDDFLDAHATKDSMEDISEREEGSGDEGSGFGILPDTGVLGCIENCTTPGPVGVHDEEHASQPPSAIDQAVLLLKDLHLIESGNAPTRSSKDTTATTSSVATAKTSAPVPVEEPKLSRKTESKLDKQPDKIEDVEVIANGTKTGELERASVPQDSTAVYAIVGVGLFLAVLFIIAFVKNRSNRRRQGKRDIPNSFGEEMKPLNKITITSTNDKPKRNSNIPENVPLINGQNGKAKDKGDTPKLTSFTPLAHPEQTKDETVDDMVQQNGYNSDPEGVEIRPRTNPELLTPPRERVTIRESEIPDSIPKTPVLVQRKKNSEGEIVTIVVP